MKHKNIPKLLVKSKILCYCGKGVEVILPFAGIAQLVEQRIENPRVRSSNLRPGITQNPALCGVFVFFLRLQTFIIETPSTFISRGVSIHNSPVWYGLGNLSIPSHIHCCSLAHHCFGCPSWNPAGLADPP